MIVFKQINESIYSTLQQNLNKQHITFQITWPNLDFMKCLASTECKPLENAVKIHQFFLQIIQVMFECTTCTHMQCVDDVCVCTCETA